MHKMTGLKSSLPTHSTPHPKTKRKIKKKAYHEELLNPIPPAS
jgi:hypothetical protein